MNPYLSTVSGKKIDLLLPDFTDFEACDFLIPLANETRYAGHVPRTYSVLQHLILCGSQADHSDCGEVVAAMLHDLHEAVCKDIPTPIKWVVPEYKVWEDMIEAQLHVDLGVTALMAKHADTVRKIDLRVLNTEAIYLDVRGGDDWPSLETYPAYDMTPAMEILINGREGKERYIKDWQECFRFALVCWIGQKDCPLKDEQDGHPLWNLVKPFDCGAL